MLILSLDTAGSGCSVCVWRDGKVLAQAQEKMERGQDQRLIPLLLDIAKQAGIEFTACDRIAVTRGPGSFTGLRIGLAAARGIGLAAARPVIGIGRFGIYREHYKGMQRNLLVALDSRRKEYFCQFFPASGQIPDPNMMTPEEISTFLKNNPSTLAGDAALPGIQPAKESEAVTCAMLAAAANENDPAFLPRPLYLRAPDVTVK